MFIIKRIIVGLTKRIKAIYIYALGMVPLFILVNDLIANQLGVDPLKELEHSLGKIALIFLILTLSISPLSNLLSINLIKLRRPLGLLCFFYVVLHLSTWLFLDMQFRWPEIIRAISKQPYIILGMLSFILLFPLAITSTNYAIKQLGPRWKKLHKLIYVSAIIAGAHYLMVVKSWPLEPIIYFLIIILLLAVRWVKLKKYKQRTR